MKDFQERLLDDYTEGTPGEFQQRTYGALLQGIPERFSERTSGTKLLKDFYLEFMKNSRKRTLGELLVNFKKKIIEYTETSFYVCYFYALSIYAEHA